MGAPLAPAARRKKEWTSWQKCSRRSRSQTRRKKSRNSWATRPTNRAMKSIIRIPRRRKFQTSTTASARTSNNRFKRGRNSKMSNRWRNQNKKKIRKSKLLKCRSPKMDLSRSKLWIPRRNRSRLKHLPRRKRWILLSSLNRNVKRRRLASWRTNGAVGWMSRKNWILSRKPRSKGKRKQLKKWPKNQNKWRLRRKWIRSKKLKRRSKNRKHRKRPRRLQKSQQKRS